MQRRAIDIPRNDPRRELQASRVGVPPSGGLGALPAPPPKGGTPTHATQGFALVIALSMMAFVLVLLLSMTLLVQVETTNSRQALNQLRAKESARLALMMALGDLQRYAGPDQRVTARAEILGSSRTTENPYWTGVWDTEDENAPPRWMVSWQDQSATAPTKTLELAGSGSIDNDATQHVAAPIITVKGNGNSTADEIAWSISDEASKASLGTVPLNARADPSFLSNNAVNALELQVASVQGLEELISGYDRFTSSEADDLERISSIAQGLNLLSTSQTADINGEAAYHVFSPASYGVLANVLPSTESDSGLMRDLSLYPRLLGTGVEEFLTFGETHAAIQEASGSGVAGLRLYTDMQGLDAYSTLNDGDIATPIVPILSNMMIAFTITSEAPVSNHLNFILRSRFFCEFWNPFTHTLNMENSDGSPINLELEITGFPDVSVYRVGTLTASAPISLQSLMGDPSSNGAVIIRLINDTTEPWLPGRSKNWVGIERTINPVQSPYQSVLTDEKKWTENEYTLGKENDDNNPSGIDTGEIRFPGNLRHKSIGQHTLRIKVYAVAGTSRELLSDLDGFVYEPVSTRIAGYGNTHAGVTFGYHFILRDPHQSNDDPDYFRGLWLFDHDPRNPKPKLYTDWHLNNDPGADSGSPYAAIVDGLSAVNLPEPQTIHQKFGADQNTIDSDRFERIHDRSIGGSNSDSKFYKLWQDTPLFELPRKRVVSLASLQHLYFHNERPFQVGNSWGSDGAVDTSKWFDRYYFSGISRNDTADDFQAAAGPANPALVNYDLEDGSNEILSWQVASAADTGAAREPAAHFMVANRFNINSTSAAAWKAVLGSLRISGFNYLDYPEEDTSDLSTLTINNASKERMFARFSHSLLETYEATETPAYETVGSDTYPVAPSAFYRHGARRLTEQQLADLAEDIVDQITVRERPFFSMEEFLSAVSGTDESIIEQAIASALAPTGKQQWFHEWEINGDEAALTGSSIDIDHFSPGFLTQADVLTAIGPMLAPRSDTFKIRARSQTYTELGELAGSAAVEAIVQRTPEAMNPTSNNLGSTERKFTLLSIRWLNADEI